MSGRAAGVRYVVEVRTAAGAWLPRGDGHRLLADAAASELAGNGRAAARPWSPPSKVPARGARDPT